MRSEAEYFEEVKDKIDTQKYNDALILVNEGLAFYPESSKLLYRKGVIYYYTNQYDLAIEHYQYAITKDPDFAYPESGLGIVYDKLGKYALAVEHHKNAIARDPDDAHPENGLGNVYDKMGKYALAVEHYKNAIAKDPYDTYSEQALGNMYNKLGKYTLAVEHYKNAIAKDPDFAYPKHGLGVMYNKLGKYDLAIEHYQYAIAKDPYDTYFEHGLGNVYNKLGKYALAIEHYQYAIAKDPDFPYPEYGLGNVYDKLGKYALAIEHYKNAIAKDPDYANPEHGLGIVYTKLGKYALAIEHYKNAIAKDPDYANPEHGLGNVYDELGKYALAIEHYQYAIAKDPDYANPEYDLGSIYNRLNDSRLAKYHFLRFIELKSATGDLQQWSTLVSFLTVQSPAPFVVAELLKRYAYEEVDFLGIWKKIRQQTEDLELYLTYIKYRQGSDVMPYHYLRALVYFFMDLPFETHRICDTVLDTEVEAINLPGNYYWITAVAAYSVPNDSYTSILDNAIDEAEKVITSPKAFTPAEIYYAGQIFWTKFLLTQDSIKAESADACFVAAQEAGFLPAAYMRVLTLQALGFIESVADQIQFVKVWEDENLDGPGYLKGYKAQPLDTDRVDFQTPFWLYAHFYEIREAIEIVAGTIDTPFPQFYEIWQLNVSEAERKGIQDFVEKEQLKELKEGILRSYQESVNREFTEQKAKDLHIELKKIHLEVTIAIERLFKKAEEYKASGTTDEFETKEIAQFIHGNKIPDLIIIDGKHVPGREIYWKLIAYFMYNQDIEPLQAFSLMYYAFFLELKRKPRPFVNIFFKDSNLEGLTDIGKDMLEEGAKALVTIGLEMTLPNIFPLKFFVGFVIKSLISNIAMYFQDADAVVSSWDSYQSFKKLLDDNTFEYIKQYHPRSELEQEALDIIKGWYSYR